MANPNYNGFKWDEVNSRLYIYVQGTAIGYVDSTGFVLASGKGLVCPGTTTLAGVAYTWPATDGTTGQDLNTNGSGTLSWA
jgi:hypothetical protein